MNTCDGTLTIVEDLLILIALGGLVVGAVKLLDRLFPCSGERPKSSGGRRWQMLSSRELFVRRSVRRQSLLYRRR